MIKANNDLQVAEHEMRLSADERITEAVCFHCQQAVEKYLKAYLVYRGVDFGKTHNVEFLLAQCAQYDETFSELDAGNLTYYAVEIRYPDTLYTPSSEEAEESISIARRFKSVVLNKIRL